MKLEKKLLQTQQYSDAKNYVSRMALLDFAVKKFDLWQWSASHYKFDKNSIVLEVGVGTGEIWKHLSSNIQLTQKIILTDFTQNMLDSCKENLENISIEKFHFELADVEKLKYEDKSMDVVLAHLMLYHATSPEKALMEISRVLKLDGWVGVSTFTVDIFKEIFELANKIDSRFPDYSVVVAPFDEKIADKTLPNYFGHIHKWKESIDVHVKTNLPILNLLKTHPVSQSLNLDSEFFNAFDAQLTKIIQRWGYFKTVYTPVLYRATKLV